jgi:hypothetical protein
VRGAEAVSKGRHKPGGNVSEGHGAHKNRRSGSAGQVARLPRIRGKPARRSEKGPLRTPIRRTRGGGLRFAA